MSSRSGKKPAIGNKNLNLIDMWQKIRQLFGRINWKWVFFMSIFTIVCLEIFGRIYLAYVLQKSPDPKFRFNSYRLYEHVPGFREGDGKKDWIVINGQGFRRTSETSIQKPQDTFRVFLMGGSAAHGISSAPPYPVVHVYPEETIDAHLEKILNEKYPGKKFEVINAAVTGYQVYQHTPYLLSELIDYQPDLVIFSDGANDHYINNPNYNYYAGNRYQFWKSRLQEPSLGGIFDYTMHWFASFSAFAKAYEAWHMNKDAEKYYNAEKYEQMITDYTSNAERISSHRKIAAVSFLRSVEANLMLLKLAGIEVLVSHQAELALRDTLFLSATEKSFLRPDENMKTLYPVVVSELDSVCSKYHVPFVDVVPLFNDSSLSGDQLFIDYCHLNSKGGEITARAMLPEVEKLLNLNTRSDSIPEPAN